MTVTTVFGDEAVKKQVQNDIRMCGVAYVEEIGDIQGVKIYRRLDPMKVLVYK